MNPLLNPRILFPFVRNYLFDPGRLVNSAPKEIKNYKDKAFRRMVKFAYNVPLYHEKYKKAGVHPSDIKGIQDIVKLPFITKDDIKQNFPDKIVPVNFNKDKGHVVCTGGTTGKPVCLYTNFLTIGRGVSLAIRQMRLLKIDPKNVKLVHIGNFNPYRIDMVARDHFYRYLKPFYSGKNILNIDVNTPISEMIKKLENFNPGMIMSYPAIFQHLAFFRRKGKGKGINPKICWTGGAMLDDYTRNYVEGAFKTRLLNVYPSVEAGGDIAFECLNGKWHVHDDFYHLEAMDENGDILDSGKRGHLVMTRLWGYGTPILRYTGMDDWVKIIHDVECDCGLCSTIIENGIEGRMRANIILPGGKVFPPGAFCFIEPVVSKYKTFKIKKYQVVQKKIDEIDVSLVIDEDLRNVGPSVETIMKEVKEIYQQKSGPKVKITVKEVKEIKPEKGSTKPPPIVVSRVKIEEGYKALENA
jgi:phenylacetate-CoA ligase